MQIKINDLKKVLLKLANKYVSQTEADYFAEEVIEAHIRKYPRYDILDSVVTDAKRQEKYRKNKIRIIKELPALMKVDFQHLPLTFKIKWIHDVILKKAKTAGVALFAFDNSAGMHAVHTWSQGLIKQGLFVLASFNGGPAAVIPANGTKGLLGTNPISYGFPTVEGNTIVDMATSEIPFFELDEAKKSKLKLRRNCIVDNMGRATTDPAQALDDTGVSNILPIGGSYKGYAINYLFEIMTGALIGAKLSDQQDLAYINEEHGGLIMAIDISAFTKIETFKNNVSRFNTSIRSQKPVQGKEIKIPGDDNFKKYLIAKKNNQIILDEKTWQALIAMV